LLVHCTAMAANGLDRVELVRCAIRRGLVEP
jgi:hypothetical protein